MDNQNQNRHEVSGEVSSMGSWLLTYLLLCIPIVGFVMLFVWAFGNTADKSKQNWARASLVWMVIGAVATILAWGAIIGFLVNFVNNL
ncbi:hypothetical protein FACS189425_09670 [Clostridia bacterium]|nr:hypothetical protein FACS189425_09670 [Clostridia bacterium]